MDRRSFLQRSAVGILFSKFGIDRMKAANNSALATFGPVTCENIEATSQDIKVRFLGTGAAGWKEGTKTERRMSSVLIDDYFLIDFTLSAEATLPANIHPTDILYTHSHSDHFQPDRAVLLGVKRVYVSETWANKCKSKFNSEASAAGVAAPTIVPLHIGVPFMLHGIQITPLPANHATGDYEEQALIYLLEKGSSGANLGVRLLYATDTGGIMGIASKISGFDSHITPGRPITGLIMEATMGINHDEDFRIFNHSSAKTVSRIANMLIATDRYFPPKGQPVYLTHMSYSLHDKLNQDQLNAVLPSPLHAAYDGLVAVFKPSTGEWGYVPPIEPITLLSETIISHTRGGGNMDANFPSSFSSDKSPYKGAFQATAVDGVIYTNDATAKELLSFKCFDKQGACIYTDLAKGTDSYGTTSDDAGNLIMRNDGNSTSPNKLIIYSHANPSHSVSIDFSLAHAGKTNFIAASGDVMSAEGGYVYFYPNGQVWVEILRIEGGVLLDTTSVKVEEAASNNSVIPVDNNPQKFYYCVRSKGIYYYCGENKGCILPYEGTTAPALNTTNGGAYLTLGGHELLVYSSGSNQDGGFSIMDLTAETNTTTILTQVPMGNIGTKGNMSYSTSFKVEKVNDYTAMLYVYCLGNGYAVYQISTKDGAPTTISAVKKETKATCYPNPFTSGVRVESELPLQNIAIYNLEGALCRQFHYPTATTAFLDLSALPKGIYILRSGAWSQHIVKK